MSACEAPRIPRDVAVVLVEHQPRNLNPLRATDAVSQKIGNLIHAALVRTGADMKPAPELAESWSVSRYRRFVFRLKTGLRFHDGAPLGAGDVVRSLQEFTKGTPHAAAFARIQRIEARGAREVLIETDRPQPYLLDDLVLAKVFRRDAVGRVIGAGRFMPSRETPSEIRVRRFEGFPEAVPRGAFREIVFRYVHDDTTRYQLLLRGDANAMISALSLTKTSHLRAHPPQAMRVLDTPGVNVSYLCLNFRNPKLADLRVRRAIAHAIDVDGVLRHRIQGMGYRATGLMAPAHGESYEPDVARHGHDPGLAERILDEAGYPRPSPSGERFQLVMKTTSEKFAFDMATLISGSLRRIGIGARLHVVEQGTFFADAKSGNFDLYHSRWIGIANPSIYYRVFHSSQASDRSTGGVNRGAYANPEMDRLLDRGREEADDAKRRVVFSEVQRLAARDLPYINLWHWNNTFIGTRDMENVIMFPNGNYLTLAGITRLERKASGAPGTGP